MNKILLCLLLLTASCQQQTNGPEFKEYKIPYIKVLGIAQDAGFPQANCNKDCCKSVFEHPELRKSVTSLGLIDPISNESWIFDATPDFTTQLQSLKINQSNFKSLSGIFLTHAHIGHYSGLMYLGREAMGADGVPVYAMPKMTEFLESNEPWKQLIQLKNIQLNQLRQDSVIVLNKRLSIMPILVPHRDELSETVGFIIIGQGKKVLFIPDITKWSAWSRDIVYYIKNVDYAFLDGTFFQDGEIERDMSEVPHPFVIESMAKFKNLSDKDKKKIYFIHFNHTNPLLIEGSIAQKSVLENGFNVAKQELIISF
jgi:pyrroloquinoline quinone biosynthesis protein B